MPLAPGTHVGSYEILGLLGAGGMGEVYRARDTTLNRDVALKVLLPLVANDPDRLARFRREAQVLASLNDPHIAQIYGFEDAGGTHALVMELVDGPTLAERIAHGPIPLDDALAIARQIAAALETAHQQGIVHRDLKPANIKLKGASGPTPTRLPDGGLAPTRSASDVAGDSGTVKVLDFGLAKAFGPDGSNSTADAANSPTITTPAMTQAGMILGTAAYMAPEQARGRPVDKRADIWAFGVVLYEMLAGRRPFDGDDITETLASVVKDPPDLTAVPPVARRALAMCLEKDPRKRLRDIGDVWHFLDESASAANTPPPRGRAAWWSWALAGALVAAMAAAGTFAVLWQRARVPLPAHAVEFELLPPDGARFTAIPAATPVSPDGRAIVFLLGVRTDQDVSLWVRRLDSQAAYLLPGTKGASCPFWSPDSQSVAFVRDGKLRRIAIAGGSPETLADVRDGCRGGTWSRTGTIVLGTAAGLFAVPASGGTLRLLRVLDGVRHELALTLPQALPDGRHFLFFTQSADENVAGTYVSSIDAPGEETRIVPNALARYVAPGGAYPGFLLWPRDRTLVAQRFDARTFRLDGDPSPVVDNVALLSKFIAFFAVSDDGVLVHANMAAGNSTLTWLDRAGHATGTVGDREAYGEQALSPDGSRVAVFRRDTVGEDLWFIDLARGASARLTTDPGNESYPVWSPDGTQLVFGSNRTAGFDLYRKPAGVSGQADVLLKSPDMKYPLDWSRDGRYLLYDQQSAGKSDWDLWVLPMDGGGQPAKYFATPFNETNAKFSPDGRWVAYQSNQSARFEIYVSPFPEAATAPAALVSTTGGTFPRWARDGRALYYISADDELMAVPVTPGATFKAGTPVPLFKLSPLLPAGSGVGGWRWDVTPDGQRFLVEAAADQNATSLIVDTDWRAKLPH
jgi:Tol biopolymer transport system component